MRYGAGRPRPSDFDYARPARRGAGSRSSARWICWPGLASGRSARASGPARGSAARSGGGKSGMAKTGYILATVFALVIVVAGIGGFAVYRHLEGNITDVTVGGLHGRTIYGAQNILVLGSQIRARPARQFFGIAAGSSIYTSNSDNLLVVHLDPTHTHATMLSIPRDTFVYEPACKARSRSSATASWRP